MESVRIDGAGELRTGQGVLFNYDGLFVEVEVLGCFSYDEAGEEGRFG
jgi:hypothetical protein